MEKSRQEQLKFNAEELLAEASSEIKVNEKAISKGTKELEILDIELNKNIERNKEIRSRKKVLNSSIKALKDINKPLVKERKFLEGTVERLTTKEDE